MSGSSNSSTTRSRSGPDLPANAVAALLSGLDGALKREFRTPLAEQLPLFSDLEPIPWAVRAVIRALAAAPGAKEVPEPPLDEDGLLAALEGPLWPQPDSVNFHCPVRLAMLYAHLNGIRDTGLFPAGCAERVLKRLARLSDQACNAEKLKSFDEQCHPWGVGGERSELERASAYFGRAFVHGEVRLANLRAELFSELLRPPGTVHEGDCSVTTALGCIRYRIDRRQQRASIELRNLQGIWQPANDVWRVDAPLLSWHWLDTFMACHAHLLWFPYYEATAEDRKAITRALREEVEASGLIPNYRRSIVREIVLDPEVQALVNVVVPNCARLYATSRDFTEIWQNRAAWQDAVLDNPGMAALLHLGIEEWGLGAGSSLHELRRRLLEEGLGKSGWQYLCRHGTAAFAPAISVSTPAKSLAYVVFAVRHLKETCGPVPQPELQRALFSCTHLVRRLESISLPPRLIELADAACIAAKAAGRLNAFLDDEWLPVLSWYIERRPTLQRNQWAGRWEYLLRAKSAWMLRLLASGSAPEWTEHTTPIAREGLRVAPLVSRALLAVEGVEMAHCVADYVERCLEGTYRAYSVTNADTGRRVATVGIEWDKGGWKLHQANGRANRAVEPRVAALGRNLAHAYNGSLKRCAAPSATPPTDLQELLASLEDD